MMEDKTKLVERVLNQLHVGNFNPCVKSEVPTPEPKDLAHPLEMSCIPHVASPGLIGDNKLGSMGTMFFDTPELVSASKSFILKQW